jgi:phosphopantetheinyl transferase
MIYTVIARTDVISKYFRSWDCSTEQPLNLIKVSSDGDEIRISPDIINYINVTGNEKTKKERISAYTSLFFTLDTLFNIKPSEILRTEFSKPYIRENIFFSISHADDLTAVSLSDDMEVGVYIQWLISEKRGNKIENRFLSNFEYYEKNFDISYLYLTVDKDERLIFIPFSDFSDKPNIRELLNSHEKNIEGKIEDIALTLYDNEKHDDTSFTKKWTAAEAMLKLHGGGLSDLKMIADVSKTSECNFKFINLGEKKYVLANAIYKNNYQ